MQFCCLLSRTLNIDQEYHGCCQTFSFVLKVLINIYFIKNWKYLVQIFTRKFRINLTLSCFYVYLLAMEEGEIPHLNKKTHFFEGGSNASVLITLEKKIKNAVKNKIHVICTYLTFYPLNALILFSSLFVYRLIYRRDAHRNFFDDPFFIRNFNNTGTNCPAKR